MGEAHGGAIDGGFLPRPGLLPVGAVGIDAGMTLTKVAHGTVSGVGFEARETRLASERDLDAWLVADAALTSGVTGARASLLGGVAGVQVQEIEAGARGTRALLDVDGRLGAGEFLLALLGTGTGFAAVRNGAVQHLGGTPMGGGSFAGIARRVDPSLTYGAIIAGATRGDRRRVDVMISDIYPDGIGRIGPDLTAAHLARAGEGSLDDFLAGLLNLHGENIAQIAAGRAQAVRMSRVVLAGGFAHGNAALVRSVTSMAALFGLSVETAPWPAYAGALGAALIAAETKKEAKS
jgi:type II pantothenate kinase